jgi:predicted AlkP superfamily pyrophosphatase or phosphodiesterase
MTTGGWVVPRYGSGALCDLVPSALSALGVAGFENTLGIESMPGVCILVIDGLGWELLSAHRDTAPFLSEAADHARPLTAGFPATTSASLASLGTGLPSGRHGMVGYTFALPGYDHALNSLQWELYGIGAPAGSMVEELVPEQVQPEPTVVERAAAAGLEITLVGPAAHANSGLTRAILRGGRYQGADTLQELVLSARAAMAEGRTSVYAYHPFLDTYGHLTGAGSDEWLGHLSAVDQAAEAIADGLPAGFSLVVTADHGMVNVTGDGRIDVADEPALLTGVRLLAGEGRARHVYTDAGADGDVAAAWRETLGDRMLVVLRDEAIEAGWFGPVVTDRVRPRIGDVVAVARAEVAVFQREVDPLQAGLVGHHGSLTETEQLVPLIQIRR